jgi:hypothetical protein
LISSFVIGACRRINERMRAEVTTRQANDAAAKATQSTGRGLVLATKTQMISAEFAKLGMKLRSTSRRSSVGSNAAYSAGQSAGNGAQFSRPINGGGGVRAIR